MKTNTEVSRITIDIPKDSHKKLKALAALLGKSMREIVVESIEKRLYGNKKTPNKETLKAIQDAELEKDLTEAHDATDLFKKLGI